MSSGRLSVTSPISVGFGMQSTIRHTVLGYVFGRRKDEVFRKLKDLLEPFGI